MQSPEVTGTVAAGIVLLAALVTLAWWVAFERPDRRGDANIGTPARQSHKLPGRPRPAWLRHLRGR